MEFSSNTFFKCILSYLDNNKIGDKGCKYIAKLLMPSIKTLALSNYDNKQRLKCYIVIGISSFVQKLMEIFALDLSE